MHQVCMCLALSTASSPARDRSTAVLCHWAAVAAISVARTSASGYLHSSRHHLPAPGFALGRGLAIIHFKERKISPVLLPVSNLFNSTIYELFGSTPTIIPTVYRPPLPNNNFAGFSYTSILSLKLKKKKMFLSLSPPLHLPPIFVPWKPNVSNFFIGKQVSLFTKKCTITISHVIRTLLPAPKFSSINLNFNCVYLFSANSQHM